jgi:hypothetical protein
MTEIELIKVIRSHYAEYHNHKETMAYSIFALEGAFFIGLFLLSTWPPSVQKMDRSLLALIFAITWMLFHSALRFQLRNRRLAAIFVAGSIDALTKSAEVSPADATHFAAPESNFLVIVDTYLFPVPGVVRNADISIGSPAPTEVATQPISPNTVRALNHYLQVHQIESYTHTGRYGYPMEIITSLGSMFLLAVALLRVFSS